MKLRIFYSWQTTTNTKFNKNFILDCIEKAVKKLCKKPEFKDVEFLILEGVKGEPGSPSVASKITDERIPNCDIFIADLSVVNQINKFSKLVQSLLGDKFKPFQNNNVINEYGVASNAIGFQRIIGVLNSTYGSPNENPDNIPFDIRHIRFPIEYNYNEKTKSKEQVQTQLVNDLAIALRDTSLFALQHQKNRYAPLIVWSDWEKRISTEQQFIPNLKIEEISKLVLDGVNNKNQTLRILGLSGLGKTRIMLEVFRPDFFDEKSILLSSRVLYLNCNLYPSLEYQTIFNKISSEGEDRIVILDNCPKTLHRECMNLKYKDKGQISLITIDSNPEEIEQDKINGVNYIIIRKDDMSSIVDEILKRDFPKLGEENIKRIKEFSQGIPLMAVLLGESIKNGEKFIGKLDDKELLDKLLGEKGQDNRSRTILEACSIFNYFGFYDDLSTQVEFIATNKNITSINGDGQVIVKEFHSLCQYYLKREIFEKKGRFIGLRPFPLAISLAQEWLEPCTPKRLISVINDIAKLSEPDRSNLSEALAEQMKFLGYNDKAVEIIEKIIGPESPFDNAEVLNTELGSRLFRSFVEVNPIAVSQNFFRQFSNKSTEELLKVDKGRRNIVWVLEKLCFDKRTFLSSVKLLYSFAVAENESWANNATGQLLHLFNILLSGTEANLKERWSIIEWALAKESSYYNLAIKAMRTGLNYGHFSRLGGSEKQGTRILHDYEPSWSEVEVYWNNILAKLTEVIKQKDEFDEEASNIIASSIRSICRAGLGRILVPYLKEVATLKNFDWDEGLQGLQLAKKYEKNRLSEEERIEIDNIIGSLIKNDFITKYTKASRYSYLNDEEPYSGEKHKAAIIALAEEFIQNNLSWSEYLPIIYKTNQAFTYFFGKRIFELLNESDNRINDFIDTSLLITQEIKKEERNLTVLGGFISTAPKGIKDQFYKKLYDSDDLNYLLFYFISIDVEARKYLDLLFDLINDKKSNLSNFYMLSNSNVLGQLNGKEINEFAERLFVYGDEGTSIAFDLLFDIAYNDLEKRAYLIPVFKQCIYTLGFNRSERHHFDHFKWSQTITFIISDEAEDDFAIFINESIIKSISWENTLNLEHDVQRIYEILVKKHFRSIWPTLSQALLSEEEDYIRFYGLKNVLGSHIGDFQRSVGILFDGDINTIFHWCSENTPLAPARLAELVPIFDNDNKDYTKWHPLALRLINEYGEISDVRSNLSSNMGTFSWTGSIVPLLEGKKELFKFLENHSSEQVRSWASSYLSYIDKEIEKERNHDEESSLY